VRALYFFTGIALLAASVVAFGNRIPLLSASECWTVSGAASEPASSAVAAGEVLKESLLDEILRATGRTPRPGRKAEKDRHQETNCAANAAYLALTLAGKPEPLREIVQSLGVSGAGQETSLETIRHFLRERGVGCAAVRGGPELLEMLKSGFALLHATKQQNLPGGRSESMGHYLLVDDYDPFTGTLRVYDPPVLPYRSPAGEVLKPWTGHALLLGDSAWALSRRNAGLTAIGVVLLGGAALCFGASVHRRRGRHCRPLLGAFFLLPGCLEGGGDRPPAPKQPKRAIKVVREVGPKKNQDRETGGFPQETGRHAI